MKNFMISDTEVEVHKKHIKHLYLSVLPPEGKVRVSAPKKMTDEEIRIFLLKKINWIRLKQEKYKNQPKQYTYEYVSGESIYLWGESLLIEVVYSNVCNKIKVSGDRLIFQVRESSTLQQREKAINEWYRENIKKEIPKILEKWQKIIGVTANEWGVKNMKTRWGTCNVRDKRIWINLQLAKKYPQCIEYVIVHELVHLLEKTHNKIFTGYMDKFLPDWRETKKILNITAKI